MKSANHPASGTYLKTDHGLGRGMTLTRIGRAQGLASVDRLRRIARVSPTPVRRCEDEISIAGLLRR
jgi:hypothetical protein